MLAAATKEEITSSGTLVAALLFRNVYGTSAERALDVFVALDDRLLNDVHLCGEAGRACKSDDGGMEKQVPKLTAVWIGAGIVRLKRGAVPPPELRLTETDCARCSRRRFALMKINRE